MEDFTMKYNQRKVNNIFAYFKQNKLFQQAIFKAKQKYMWKSCEFEPQDTVLKQ